MASGGGGRYPLPCCSRSVSLCLCLSITRSGCVLPGALFDVSVVREVLEGGFFARLHCIYPYGCECVDSGGSFFVFYIPPLVSPLLLQRETKAVMFIRAKNMKKEVC
uniref:Putative secreted protein n=1 Tax=Anopheles darlingi TaxID=43151 RepID=A0A2M4D2T5_ANODA